MIYRLPGKRKHNLNNLRSCVKSLNIFHRPKRVVLNYLYDFTIKIFILVKQKHFLNITQNNTFFILIIKKFSNLVLPINFETLTTVLIFKIQKTCLIQIEFLNLTFTKF